MIGYRNMLCGMHVHVAVPDVDTRINLIMRLTPYLPLLLALSTSSPFWQGHLTGLVGYRLAAYDELPRTGLPELFRTNDDYREFVAALTWAKIIPDASYIWWAMRPSLNNPTIELRVADSCTRLDDAIAIAALFRCLVRALDRDRALNAGFDRVGRAITQENKWHAQRYGIGATFVEPFSRSPLTLGQWLDQVIDFIAEDVDALGCAAEIRHLHSHRRARHQRGPSDRDLRQGKGRRPQKVNGAQGGRRLGSGRNPGARAAPKLKSERHPGFPLSSGPLIKRDGFTRTAPSADGDSWQRRQSTSSTDPI